MDALHEAIRIFRRSGCTDHRGGIRSTAAGWTASPSPFLTLHEQTGDMAALAESVDLFRGALLLPPLGDDDRSSSLGNLANAPLRHYQQSGDLGKLAEAIDLQRAALSLHSRDPPRPQRHAWQPRQRAPDPLRAVGRRRKAAGNDRALPRGALTAPTRPPGPQQLAQQPRHGPSDT
jgi:hypothetical protein